MEDLFRRRTINTLAKYCEKAVKESEEISQRHHHQVTVESVCVTAELSLLRRLITDLGLSIEVNKVIQCVK